MKLAWKLQANHASAKSLDLWFLCRPLLMTFVASLTNIHPLLVARSVPSKEGLYSVNHDPVAEFKLSTLYRPCVFPHFAIIAPLLRPPSPVKSLIGIMSDMHRCSGLLSPSCRKSHLRQVSCCHAKCYSIQVSCLPSYQKSLRCSQVSYMTPVTRCQKY